MPLSEEDARARVEEEKGFFVHAAVFLVVMSGLIALNLITSPGTFWAIYPLLGWGIGVGSHAAQVFGLPGVGRSWEERRLRELTGEHNEEAQAERLRQLLESELDERAALPASSSDAMNVRLQQRIEHLEAIVTSQDWDQLEQAGRPGIAEDLKLDEAAESDAERAGRLARKVR